MEIGIPGHSSGSGIDTQQLIQDLVKAERQPIERLESNISNSTVQGDLWNELESDLMLLGDFAKKLYSFENPFDMRTTTSSDESIMSVEAERGAAYGEYDLVVKQIATSDRWASDELREDFAVFPGEYVFSVGKKTINFYFEGGTLDEFSRKINEEGKETISAHVIKRGVQEGKTTFVLQGLGVGKSNALRLSRAAKDFATRSGLETELTGENVMPLTLRKTSIAGVHSDPQYVVERGSELTLLPGALLSIEKGMSDLEEGTMELRFVASATSDSQEEQNVPKKRDVLRAELQGIVVEGDESDSARSILPDEAQIVGNVFPIVVASQTGVVVGKSEAEISDRMEFTVGIDVENVYDTKEGLLRWYLLNPFPHYEFTLKQARIVSREARDGRVPKHPLSVAQNAVVEFQGIDFERAQNTIDDLIPGLKLHARRPSDVPIRLTVGANMSLIKDDIIRFIGSYNQVMRDILLFSSTREDVLEDMRFSSVEERENARKNKLGRLSGNYTLTTLGNKLRSIVTQKYGNTDRLMFLRDIGIAAGLGTETRGAARSRYLDIEESTLESALENHLEAVANLFGGDVDGDFVADSGIAFAVKKEIDPFVQTGGIIDQKQRTIATQVERDRAQINRYEERIEDYERELKRKFGSMERSLGKLEDITKSLEGLPGGKKD